MLYRRFFLVASMIALLGVGFANLVQHTKAQRNFVMEYPAFTSSQVSLCGRELHCGLTFWTQRTGA